MSNIIPFALRPRRTVAALPYVPTVVDFTAAELRIAAILEAKPLPQLRDYARSSRAWLRSP
jgi:hypothetical protein